jgi:hypothetical protein
MRALTLLPKTTQAYKPNIIKPMLAAVLFALAAHAHAATVIVGALQDINITSDPNASPAINFNTGGSSSATISTPLVTGDVIDAGGTRVSLASLVINGTSTINGNIGTSTRPLSLLSISGGANGDVYILNGLVYLSSFVFQSPFNSSVNSTVVLGGNVFADNLQFISYGTQTNNALKIDLQGNALTIILSILKVD